MLSPLLGPRLSPLLAPGPSSLSATMLSSRLLSRLSSLPASRLSSLLSCILAPLRRRPLNSKSLRRGLPPPRAKQVAPTPDLDKSPCKQMHGREIWFRYARARTIRSSASGIMMPMVGRGLISSGAGGLEGLIEAQTSPLLHRKLGWPRAKRSKPVFLALFQLHLPSVRRSSPLPKAAPSIH